MPEPVSQEARDVVAELEREGLMARHSHWAATVVVTRHIQAIRRDEAEQCARVAETCWVEADYNTVGIAGADMAMEICLQSAAAIRARHAETDQTGGK